MSKCNRYPVLFFVLMLTGSALSAQWAGFIDASDDLETDRLTFNNTAGEGPGNENYYDGDFADFNNDGLNDRILGARYGLLINRGDGWMDYFAGRTGFEFRQASPSGITGEDSFNWADIDNDGDYDVISGGQGAEQLAVQENNRGRFNVKIFHLGSHLGISSQTSATSIANSDVNGDGFVDLIVTFGFNGDPHTMRFNLFINDGTGDFTHGNPGSGLDRYFGQVHGASGVATADVDMDGDYDLVLQQGHRSDEAERFLIVAKNDGTGAFTFGEVTDVPRPGTGFGTPLSMGDVDNDGDIDFVMMSGVGVGIAGGNHPIVKHSIGINDGTGVFADEADKRFVGEYLGDTQQWSGGDGGLLDVDYDGDLDIVSSASRNGAVGYMTVYLNDGNGYFTHDVAHSQIPSGMQGGIGNDIDFTDLDGDGTYDVWIGRGGDRPHIYLNTYSSPDGLPADMPRNVAVTNIDENGITIKWSHPKFASNVRYYRVYRSTAPNLEPRDRPLVKIIGERHQDEKFFAPVNAYMTTEYLGDAEVVLDGANNAVYYTDTTAVPGVKYYYSVRHVGAQNAYSKPSAEVSATISAPTGVDVIAPELTIISPTSQDWDQFPRIVITYGDDSSGIDLGTLSVSFDQDLGDGTVAGTNIADSFNRKDATAYVYGLTPPRSVPVNEISTMTVSISDLAGNTSTEQVLFFPTITASVTGASDYPTAAYTESTMTGNAPIAVALDGSSSQDNGVGSYPQDTIFSWEWYFSDGTTATGRKITKVFDQAGDHSVTLLVRDNEGSVHTSTKSIMVNSVSRTFESFVSDKFNPSEQADSAISGPAADPDSDRMNNLLEFALGTDPLNPRDKGFSMQKIGDQLIFTYDKVSAASNLGLQWQHSMDMSTWIPITPNADVPITYRDESIEMRTTFEMDDGSGVFYRLQVTEN